MKLILEDESNIKLPFDKEEIASKVIEAAADYEGCPYEIQVNLVLSTDEEINWTNREFRGIDKPTDVLSFPAIEYDRPSEFGMLEDMPECFDPDTGELLLGDIMISVEHVFAQAEEYGHSLQREYAFLIAHSMLHLFGYDHMNDEDAKDMEKRQKEILDKLGYTRDL